MVTMKFGLKLGLKSYSSVLFYFSKRKIYVHVL